ncbi:PREDICTED: nuclear transcription factor Y subunit B-3 [Nelumbo nucifera]|nr:PREDICTED: nuclear transcription factor Y subunit B-3 [Nelumbo nucifera]
MEDDNHGNGPSGTSRESECNMINNSSSSSNSRSNNNNSRNSSNNNNNNREQDRLLPIANVGRIMKKVIPGNGKVSKDAKETVQECVSEFISFVTGEASDKCQREKRKTINGDDIIWAISTLGFENYVNPLKLYLQKYREMEGEKLNVPKQQQEQQVASSDNVNSSAHLTSQPSLLYSTNQPFSMPFSPSSIQQQMQQQEPNDSLGQW